VGPRVPATGATLGQNGWLSQSIEGPISNSKGAPCLEPAAGLRAARGREGDIPISWLKLKKPPPFSKISARAVLWQRRIKNYELAGAHATGRRGRFGPLLRRVRELSQALRPSTIPPTAPYALLSMARLLIDSGVRFVQVFCCVGNPWTATRT